MGQSKVSSRLAQTVKQLRAAPSVSEGWDLAINLSADAVQKMVESNWDDGVGERPLVWVTPGEVDGAYDVVAVHSELKAPKVSLDHLTQAANMAFNITSGNLRVGKASAGLTRSVASPESLLEHNDVQWDDDVNITPSNPLNIAGAVPLSVNRDSRGEQFSVDLNFAQSNLMLTSRDDGGITSSVNRGNLNHWLQQQKLSGQIAKLTRGPTEQGGDLAPSNMSTRIISTLSGASVLQLLAGGSASQTVVHGNNQVPHPEEYDFSVMVSSKAVMGMIANAYNVGGGQIKLIPRPPSGSDSHWYLEVHQPMVLDGFFGIEDGETFVNDRSTMYMRFGGSSDQGLKLFTYTDPSSNVQLQLDLAAHYPTEISGEGQQQLIGLKEGGQSISGEGFYENIVKGQLESFLTGDIKGDMTQVRMHVLSELLLRNLSLSGHTMQFDVSALPSELLVVGSLIRQ